MKRSTNRTTIIFLLALGMLLHGNATLADDNPAEPQELDTTDAQTEAPDEVPELGEASFFMGFHWVEADEFSRAGEYEDHESSLMLGGTLETYPLPHRFYFQGDYLGSHDYYGDIGYAYKDIVMFRDFLVGLHHNLDHYSYSRLFPPPGVSYVDRSFGDENYVDFLKNDLFLRVKNPNFPMHGFVKHRFVGREGLLQERFLIGYFGNQQKIAESREIDWKFNELALGANSHLGPVELEYTHNRSEFDPGSRSVLSDYFAAGRPPDTYPHNVIPETESDGNTLKIHTSYTGQIVSSATLSNETSANNYSGAEVEAWKGAYDLQWMPTPILSLFFRYRHLQADKETPEETTLNGLNSRTSYEVRKPVSTKKDLFSLSGRYRPWGPLTLNGSYDFEIRERTDVDEWAVLPEQTDIHRLNLSLRAKLMDSLKLKLSYQYKQYENPANNISPDHLNKFGLHASYNPTTWISALFDYSLTFTQRDDLVYLNGTRLVDEGEREGRTDLALASVSFVLNPATSVTASWAYSKWHVEQDTAYTMWNAEGTTTTVLPYYDRGTPYTDESHTFALTCSAKLRSDLLLRGGISYTLAEGTYLPDPYFLTPYSSIETVAQVYTVELVKKLMHDWEVGLKLKAGFFDDDFSGESLDHSDDELYLSTVTVKRYF